MQLRAVSRGKLSQITCKDRPVDAALYGCMVVRAPEAKVGGKVYMTIDVSQCGGDMDVVRAVDDFIQRRAQPRFSPLLPTGQLVVKVPAGVKYENSEGMPAAPWTVLTNALVDIVVRPGAFGDFGYCWLLQRIKPPARV